MPHWKQYVFLSTVYLTDFGIYPLRKNSHFIIFFLCVRMLEMMCHDAEESQIHCHEQGLYCIERDLWTCSRKNKPKNKDKHLVTQTTNKRNRIPHPNLTVLCISSILLLESIKGFWGKKAINEFRILNSISEIERILF